MVTRQQTALVVGFITIALADITALHFTMRERSTTSTSTPTPTAVSSCCVITNTVTSPTNSADQQAAAQATTDTNSPISAVVETPEGPVELRGSEAAVETAQALLRGPWITAPLHQVR